MSVSSRPLPLALRVVAWIFLFNGICAFITIANAMLHGQVNLDFDIISIFVYFGLLRLSNFWRVCAITLICLGLVMMLFVAFLAPTAAHANLSFFGINGPEISPIFFFVFLFFWFALAIWQVKVLTRPEIVTLFIDYRFQDSKSP
ncbi:MAG: hypothetical protein LV480_09275 [Methylacidiphilales bacterium]|nr:hypothetical protein [Candidatus Methylacidiphilales bacterium]